MDTPPPAGGMPPQAPVTPQIVGPMPPPPPPRRRSAFGRLLLVFFLLVFFGSILLNMVLLGWAGVAALETEHRVQEKYVSHNRTATEKVAIIAVEGVIMETDEGFVKRQIDRVIADENVKAVVLRVDSPGGSVSGSDYIYYHLRKMLDKRKIPMVVSMGGIAASGGYYVSMAVGHAQDTIYAEPTTFTGSIGVIIPHYDLSGMFGKVGVEEDSVISARLKGMGSLARPMTKEERKIFQGLVDDSFTRFKDIVKSGRARFDKDPAELDKVATGNIFLADQAKKNGLIDQIGFLEDAVDQAIKLAQLDEKEVKVVRYKPEPTLAGVLFGGQSEGRAALDLRALLEMSSPRAFYMCTWLPALAGKPERHGE